MLLQMTLESPKVVSNESALIAANWQAATQSLQPFRRKGLNAALYQQQCANTLICYKQFRIKRIPMLDTTHVTRTEIIRNDMHIQAIHERI